MVEWPSDSLWTVRVPERMVDGEGLYSPYNGLDRAADFALATPRGAGARGL